MPYDFVRRRLAIVLAADAADAPGPAAQHLLIVKGAFAQTLAQCSQWRSPEGAQPLDDRIRARFTLQSVEALPDGGAQVIWQALVEVEGSSKPACVAEMVSRRYT